MRAEGIEHYVQRVYNESGTFQWVRETFVNALEAGATRVEFGIEWEAVRSQGVYRRVIADDGAGMSPQELTGYFNTFGGGGKPIGGEHENYGVGSKTSLLPWNPYGVVVVSWQDGEGSMIWVQRDPVTGGFGLRVFEAEDPETGEISHETVVEPFDDEEHGCDWSALKPDWVAEHGTVIVLLGADATADTVLGDPARDESDLRGITSYLNRRIWEIPEGVAAYVDEFNLRAKDSWPSSPRTEAMGSRALNRRRIGGAKHFIEYPEGAGGEIEDSGTVPLSDGTEVDWFLWAGERPSVHSYASKNGYVAVLYRNELYDISADPKRFTLFGVSAKEVRDRVWLVIRPPLVGGETKRGVYPRTDRSSLLIRGGVHAGHALPFDVWASEFATHLPEPIYEAVRAAHGSSEGSIQSQEWRERLVTRFGDLWKLTRFVVSARGLFGVDPTFAEEQRSKRPIRAKRLSSQNPDGRRLQRLEGDRPSTGSSDGSSPSVRVRRSGELPGYVVVRQEDIPEGMLASWSPNQSGHPAGAVLLNGDHPVLASVVWYWQNRYSHVLPEQIRQEIVETYAQIAVAKVAHSAQLRSVLPSSVIEDDLRSDASLTMSLLGLVAEDAVLAARLGGKFGRRQPTAT